MIFGDIDARKHARKLANEIGVDFEETGSYLSDNSNKSKDNKWHMNDNVVMSKNIFKELTDLQTPVFSLTDPVAFKGIGHSLDPENKYIFPILRAEASTTSKLTKDKSHKSSSLSGEQLTLVSGMQTRSNNRATISGSMDMCSDEFIRKSVRQTEDADATALESSVNYDFCRQLANWNF